MVGFHSDHTSGLVLSWMHVHSHSLSGQAGVAMVKREEKGTKAALWNVFCAHELTPNQRKKFWRDLEAKTAKIGRNWAELRWENAVVYDTVVSWISRNTGLGKELFSISLPAPTPAKNTTSDCVGPTGIPSSTVSGPVARIAVSPTAILTMKTVALLGLGPRALADTVTKFNTCEIYKKQPLGNGTRGEVFAGKSERDGDLAIKVFRETATIGGMLEEVAAHSATGTHPNLVSLLDVGTDGVLFYLAFPRFSCDLDGFLLARGGPLEIEEIRRIIHHVLLGVRHLHAEGVLHTDLKPANILLKTRGTVGGSSTTAERLLEVPHLQVVIADFGRAMALCVSDRAIHKTETSLPYRAPEVFFGDTNFGCTGAQIPKPRARPRSRAQGTGPRDQGLG